MSNTSSHKTSVQVMGQEVVSLRSATASVRHSDFAEIEPVAYDGQTAASVYGIEARAAGAMIVEGPGLFDIASNPDFVSGAYANLRHHQVRDTLKFWGLACEPGLTHLVPLPLAGTVAISFDIATGRAFSVTYGEGELAFTSAMLVAAAAAKGTGATHIAVRIS
ncbi:hypothetical protein ACOI1H_20005 [Loktanella sp. DJP18]|uniref:hypothetical protein n=1 Tax=Loktanella sp. DJP18 TaxID=3409788 RepID=UPI003BB4D455